MVFANNLADVGMWSYMTMLPVDLGMTLQEFIISAIPLQTKLVLISSRPSWVELCWLIQNTSTSGHSNLSMLSLGRNSTSRAVSYVILVFLFETTMTKRAHARIFMNGEVHYVVTEFVQRACRICEAHAFLL